MEENDNLLLNIACVSKSYAEKDYFREYFKDKVTIVENEREKFSTYRCMDYSDVVVTVISTAGIEAFGWGKKLFFCNLSGIARYDLPISEICTINIPKYNVFRAKLDHLRGISQQSYEKVTKESAAYLMNYDPQMPAHSFIRNKTLECLEKANPVSRQI